MKPSDTVAAAPQCSSLKRLSIQGTAINVFAQFLKMALQFGSVAILARLLSPKDFGIVGMVGVVVGMLAMFNDPGLSAATVQSESITHTQVSAMFWLNVQLGLVLVTTARSVAPQ